MKLTMEDLRAFVYLAEIKTFHETAAALFITPSALSRRITKLEEYAGANLFDRTTQKVELTCIGRSLLENARALLHEFDRFDEGLSRLATSEESLIELACLTTVAGNILPKLIANYRIKNPGVRFVIRDGNGMRVTEQVRDRTVEFGIGIQAPESQDLSMDLLYEDMFFLACIPEFPLSGKKQIRWKELKGHSVTVLGGSSMNRRILGTELSRHNINLDWSDEVQSLSTQTGFVDHGIGSAVLPGLAFPYIQNKVVLKIPLVEPNITRAIVLLKRKRATFSPAATAFYSYLQSNFVTFCTLPE